MSPREQIRHGNRFPFDAPDAWWEDSGHGSKPKTPKPKDWAHAAARGIIANLQDRGGIKHELEIQVIDEDTRKEIVEEMAAVIRAASRTK
jgi:hypothetical protein